MERYDAEEVSKRIGWLISNHLEYLNKVQGCTNPRALLYRSFHYDATPYGEQAHKPVSRQHLDYGKTAEAKFRLELFECLRRAPNMAVRLGEVRKDPNRSWFLSAKAQNALLSGARDVASLTDDDFVPALRQKGVDMRLGIDMASLTLKRLADTIVLVTGDADFVPAAKLARREGVRIVLDPLWQNVSPALFEHIDGVYSGAARPKRSWNMMRQQACPKIS